MSKEELVYILENIPGIQYVCDYLGRTTHYILSDSALLSLIKEAKKPNSQYKEES